MNSILLALSVSLDSLGIGVTYGIKNVRIKIISVCILFVITIFFAYCSFAVGSLLNSIISETLTEFISSIALIIIGTIIIIDPIPFDIDHSKALDIKETILLGTTLSIDSICVGLGSSIGGYSSPIYPLFVAIFHVVFMYLGIFLGKKIIRNTKIPDRVLNFIAGILIIIFGIIRLIGSI